MVLQTHSEYHFGIKKNSKYLLSRKNFTSCYFWSHINIIFDVFKKEIFIPLDFFW